MRYEEIKIGSFCTHSYQKSFTNKIQLLCNKDDDLTHVVSQMGKICNKCSELLLRSVQKYESCLVCDDRIEQYLQEKQFCPHDDQEFDEVTIKCKQAGAHYVPLKASVCQDCLNKIVAAFNISDTCKVCQGKEADILDEFEKSVVSPIFANIKNIIQYMKTQKFEDTVIKCELQYFCKAEKRPEYESKIPKQYMVEQETNSHISNRYSLYPKCTTHRNSPVNLCNNCLAAVLNLQCCPYGCSYGKGTATKNKTDEFTKIAETGFLCMYPQQLGDSYYLDLFVIRQIEEKGRLDRWTSSLKKVKAVEGPTVKYKNFFGLFSTSTYIGDLTYLQCGGVIGSNIHNREPTGITFMLRLSPDLKLFQIMEVEPMKTKRASHAAVYHQRAKRVYVIGGFIKNQGCLKECEYFDLESTQWKGMGSLNIQRSKPSAFMYLQKLYVFGGMTPNPKIQECYAEKYNDDTSKWQPLPYSGYDFPSLTGSVSLTSLPCYQESVQLYLLGGSNYQDYSSKIYAIEIDEKKNSFELDFNSSDLSMNFSRCNSVLGLIGEDIVVVFGGLKEHESLMSIEAIKTKGFKAKNIVKPFFVYEELEIGSYRLMLRESTDHIYKKIYNSLEDEEILNKDKLNKEDEKLVNAYNCHMFEKMHYTIGKNFVWVPMDKN